jgi:cell division protein ZapA (FtsZ GTPase activity inhibitor)
MHEERLVILGRPFVARGDGDPEHLRALAAFVEQRMRSVKSGDTLARAVCAALQIADELHKVRREYTDLTRKIEALSHDLSRSLGELDQEHLEH